MDKIKTKEIDRTVKVFDKTKIVVDKFKDNLVDIKNKTYNFENEDNDEYNSKYIKNASMVIGESSVNSSNSIGKQHIRTKKLNLRNILIKEEIQNQKIL